MAMNKTLKKYRQKMAKTIILLLCGMLTVTGCTKDDKNSDLVASGTTGSLTWALDIDGTLTISGKGEMPKYFNYWDDYEYITPLMPPWYEYIGSITNVIIGDDIMNIGSGAFMFSEKMTSVIIGSSVTVIEESAFHGCESLSAINIPFSVTEIGPSAFAYCRSLTFLNIPNSVNSIGILAFRGCSGITFVAIGDSVTDFGGAAFQDCTNLTTIINYQEVPQFMDLFTSTRLGFTLDPFAGVDFDNCLLLVPTNSVETYRAAEGWQRFRNIETFK